LFQVAVNAFVVAEKWNEERYHLTICGRRYRLTYYSISLQIENVIIFTWVDYWKFYAKNLSNM
jgi:hypothetical protein